MSEVVHIGFTGTGQGMTYDQKITLGRFLIQLDHDAEEVVVHHGDCVGADSQFHDLVRQLVPKATIVAHPGHPKGKPDADTYRAYCATDEVRPLKDYRSRNQDIVNESALVYATPAKPEEKQPRSGTWMTVRMARKREGCTDLPIYPDGQMMDFSKF